MEHTYKQITSEEDRKAPERKYRVMLRVDGQDRASPSSLYLVEDCNTAEEAICMAETLGGKDRNGIVQDSKGFILYPWFDGHQLHTSKELLKKFGPNVRRRYESERPLTAEGVKIIEQKQSERIPGWKPGHRMVVFWQDIAEATGAVAHPGNF